MTKKDEIGIMKKLVSVLFIATLSLLYGCHDDSWDIGDHYMYMNGYLYRIIDKMPDGDIVSVVVPGKVYNFNYDEKFIVAFQKPSCRSYEEMLSYEEDQHVIDSLISIFDKTIEIQNCYWIINQETDEVFGPLDKQSYYNTCKDLSVKIVLDL